MSSWNRIRISIVNPDSDTDPGTPLNPDPVRIRIQSGSGSTALISTYNAVFTCLGFQGEFACDQCGKVLKSKGSLDYHKRTHSGEYAYRSALRKKTLIIFCCCVRTGFKDE
jgi:hypothetical protein